MKKIASFLSFFSLAAMSLLLVSAVFFANVDGNFANADILDSLGDLFKTGDQGLSFTQYEGQLAELKPEGYDEALTSSSNVRDFVIRIVNFALGFLGLLAVIIVIYGGVLYVTAAGEDEKTGKGKKAITYATIGLLIVLGSFAFVNTVIKGAGGGGGEKQYFVGANTGNSFNASAMEVRNLALEIYNGFVFLAETKEEFANIINDAQKDSLNYGDPKKLDEGEPTSIWEAEDWNDVKTVRAVSRGDVLNFLYIAKEKLVNVRSKFPKFSSPYININEYIRVLEKDIDKIKLIPELLVEYEYDAEFDFGYEKTSSGLEVENGELVDCYGADGLEDLVSACERYPKDLFKIWPPIRAEILGSDENKPRSLAKIFNPILKNYQDELTKKLSRLAEIRQSLTGITAVDTGGIGNLYNNMMSDYGFDIKTLKANGTTGFLFQIGSWKVNTASGQIDNAGNTLFKALENQLKFADEIAKLQAVEVHLRANVLSGNAPLVVTFDVLDSIDPAGGSIVDGNVDWTNLTGAKTIDNKEVQVGTSVSCNILAAPKEVFGPAFRQCTFDYPGTYIATVKIKSNDPTKYVTGQSSLIIKVDPPTTKINLKLNTSGKEIPVLSYFDNGVIKENKDYIAVTLEEAKNGVIFDASATENVANFKWDFGNGQVVETDATGKQTQKFEKAGKSTIILEVTNKLQEIDRKIFTLEIAQIAARLKSKPANNAFVDTPVLFDASGSKSDLGKISNYQWTISISPNQSVPEDIAALFPITESNSSSGTFMYEFKHPLYYDIHLKVTDSGQNTSIADIKKFKVESHPPVAKFEYKVPQESQPGTYQFDAGKSYDPDGGSNFSYTWTITPDTGWKLTKPDVNGLNSKNPIVKFTEAADYEVNLKVADSLATNEFSETKQTLKVENVLDLAWGNDQKVTGFLDEDGKAEVEFKIESEKAVAFEIDFGDGEKENGDLNETDIVHSYTQAGKYNVKVTVFDEQDNDNSIERKIFISGGEIPVAKITLLVNNEEIQDLSDPIIVNKKDIITFDAIASKNTDGTGKKLKYSWNFGDKKNSSQKKATHSYKELSPKDPGYYEVTLKVTDEDDADKYDEDEVQIVVINMPPTFSSVQGTPQVVGNNLVTPVMAAMKVYGAEDLDGEITKFRWWYFDVKNPDEQLNPQITNQPIAQLLIGTKGKEGDEITYGFGLEVTDSDGLTHSNQESIANGQLSTITVTNGANAMPTAKFSVNAVSVFVGDKISFSSSSTDPDGKIKNYIWDFEGDGFYNNDPTTESSVEHIYKEKNKTGFDVRLKVIDDKGGESVSEPTKVFVDSLAKPPTAAFKYKVVDGSGGMKIKFTNNSTADEGAKILSTKWDFDTDSALPTADSDGDGIKDNDTDSQAKDPERLYTEQGIYKIKLTITDDQGNTDDVTNQIELPLSNPPEAAFTYEISDNKVVFKNHSTVDAKSGNIIEKYNWDFDTNSSLPSADSNGDGKKDNDKDSQIKEPTHEYPQPGKYKVKLTVFDNHGSSDEITNEVDFSAFGGTGGATGTGGSGGTTGGAFGGVGTGTGTGTGTSGTVLNPIGTASQLKAVMTTTPVPLTDGVVYLTGTSGTVKFDFTKSTGPIAYYVIDKNIYFDTGGNGIPNDEEDFKTSLPGTYTTNFEKSWGKIVVKLTIKDIYGNESSSTQEIKFK